jgi:hypothetical protein
MCEREALTGKVSRCSQLMQRLIKLMPDRIIMLVNIHIWFDGISCVAKT